MAAASTLLNSPFNSDSEFSDAELFESLEADADLSAYREKRIEELKQELAKSKEIKDTHFGTYNEIFQEKEVLQITTSCAKCVLHMVHADFRRCAIMDVHLQILATKYPKTRFIKIQVERSPFLVHHLKVKILPCVLFFLDGITKERLIGFEELGNTDDFPITLLEKRLMKAKVIPSSLETNHVRSNRSILQGSYQDLDDEDDDA